MSRHEPTSLLRCATRVRNRIAARQLSRSSGRTWRHANGDQPPDPQARGRSGCKTVSPGDPGRNAERSWKSICRRGFACASTNRGRFRIARSQGRPASGGDRRRTDLSVAMARAAPYRICRHAARHRPQASQFPFRNMAQGRGIRHRDRVGRRRVAGRRSEKTFHPLISPALRTFVAGRRRAAKAGGRTRQRPAPASPK